MSKSSYFYFFVIKILIVIFNSKSRKLVLINSRLRQCFLLENKSLFVYYYLKKDEKLCNIIFLLLNYFVIVNNAYSIQKFLNRYFSVFELYFHSLQLYCQLISRIFYKINVIKDWVLILNDSNNLLQALFFVITLLLQYKYFIAKSFSKNILRWKKVFIWTSLSDVSLFPLFFLENSSSLIQLQLENFLKQELFFMYKKSYGHSTNWFIRQMNYILLKVFSKWKNQFQLLKISQRTFILSLDNWIFSNQFYYINRTHVNNSKLWKLKTYFGPFSPYRKEFWVFGDVFSGLYSLQSSWILDY